MSTKSTNEAVLNDSRADIDDVPMIAEDLIEEVSIDGMCGVY
jgi:mycofactocin precursor